MTDTETNAEKANLDYIRVTAEIVSAFASTNHLQPAELAALIAGVHTAIDGLVRASEPKEPAVEKLTPAQIKKSITSDALISFLDGKPYKTLKRHLTKHGLDPASYRARYGLPANYPMAAPSYSEARSALSKKNGLGRRGRKSLVEAANAAE